MCHWIKLLTDAQQVIVITSIIDCCLMSHEQCFNYIHVVDK